MPGKRQYYESSNLAWFERSVAAAQLARPDADALAALLKSWLALNWPQVHRHGWSHLLSLMSAVIDHDGAVAWRRPLRTAARDYNDDYSRKSKLPVALAWRVDQRVLLGVGREGATAQQPTTFK